MIKNFFITVCVVSLSLLFILFFLKIGHTSNDGKHVKYAQGCYTLNNGDVWMYEPACKKIMMKINPNAKFLELSFSYVFKTENDAKIYLSKKSKFNLHLGYKGFEFNYIEKNVYDDFMYNAYYTPAFTFKLFFEKEDIQKQIDPEIKYYNLITWTRSSGRKYLYLKIDKNTGWIANIFTLSFKNKREFDRFIHNIHGEIQFFKEISYYEYNQNTIF